MLELLCQKGVGMTVCNKGRDDVIVVPWLLCGYGNCNNIITLGWYKPYPQRSHGTADLYQD